ncbi:hypothetical protein D3C83_158960 [compost metagenome]
MASQLWVQAQGVLSRAFDAFADPAATLELAGEAGARAALEAQRLAAQVLGLTQRDQRA